ncbi:MAG TPA: response regulator [Anaerolineae bacterium]|nr:response regulator [Anaerolineae bacterium]
MAQSVLIVDDEAGTRDMLRMLLELDGFTVFEAEDGEDALDQVDENHPDVIILDVMMPILDGISVCKELRKAPETANVPIIMLSGKTQSSAVTEGLEAGANLYMAKPMSVDELLTNIRDVLNDDSESGVMTEEGRARKKRAIWASSKH